MGGVPELKSVFEPASDKTNCTFLFIHGLDGSPYSTWSCPEGRAVWTGLADKGARVYSLGYNASQSARENGATVEELSSMTLDALAQRAEDFVGDLIVIAHSFGGILFKHIACQAEAASQLEVQSEKYDYYQTPQEKNKKLFIRCLKKDLKVVVFRCTPHSGSIYADLRKFVPNYSDIIGMIGGTDRLQELDEMFSENFATRNDLRVEAHVETQRLDGSTVKRIVGSFVGRVVRAESAEVACGDYIMYTGGDHSDMSGLEDRLLQIAEQAASRPTACQKEVVRTVSHDSTDLSMTFLETPETFERSNIVNETALNDFPDEIVKNDVREFGKQNAKKERPDTNDIEYSKSVEPISQEEVAKLKQVFRYGRGQKQFTIDEMCRWCVAEGLQNQQGIFRRLLHFAAIEHTYGDFYSLTAFGRSNLLG